MSLFLQNQISLLKSDHIDYFTVYIGYQAYIMSHAYPSFSTILPFYLPS